MKQTSILLAILLVIAFSVFAIASTEDDDSSASSNANATGETVTSSTSSSAQDDKLGDYSVAIDSYRLAKDFSGKPVVIVKYIFSNNKNDEPTSFMFAFDDAVFQAGVGLNEAYILDDSAKYSSDNQTKEIKKGASLEVEIAYELNDTTTDIEVEVKELWSFSDKTLTKTFSIKE